MSFLSELPQKGRLIGTINTLVASSTTPLSLFKPETLLSSFVSLQYSQNEKSLHKNAIEIVEIGLVFRVAD
jgi:hypothetical protein